VHFLEDLRQATKRFFPHGQYDWGRVERVLKPVYFGKIESEAKT
jgi:hypothetical protein